ncbi:MAG: S49 family peptidase [Myxococcota bacterium]|nr:S49 family peptidase [Myxococcota bacterium]
MTRHVVTLFSAVVMSGALLACEGRHRTESATDVREGARNAAFIAVLDVSDGLPEQPSGGLLGLSSKSASFDELVREVDRLERDSKNNVKGILVRLGTARLGVARATEVGALLARVAAHRPVWCHADELGNGTLYLAAVGCRQVWISPGGTVDAIGLAAQLVFFHKLLADGLGLDVDFLQVGKYKGAEEPFTRDDPSPEARASLESTLADMRTAWLTGIRRARPAISASAAEDGPYTARAAQDRGLVDQVGYFDEARDELEKETRTAHAEVRLGPGAGSRAGGDIAEVLHALAGESLGGAPIALVHATGAISMDGAGPLGGDSGIVESRLARTLVRLERDDDVKAVVLRIDSPGGSALASDLLWHHLMRVRKRKPLVVSIGDMAASGGYYMASAGSIVFADEASIVGSIGVVGGKVAIGHALEKLGVHAETVPARVGDAKSASRATYESLLTPWDDDTRTRLLETMTGIYGLFLARIGEGRGLPIDRVALSAEGRVFSGREGKARGLVDEMGGLGDALVRARVLAGLPPDARVGVAGEPSGILQMLAQDESQGQAASRLSGIALAHFAPDVVAFVASIAPLAGLAPREPALCALPFALTVR